MKLSSFRLPLLAAITLFSMVGFGVSIPLICRDLLTNGSYTWDAPVLTFVGAVAMLLIPASVLVAWRWPEHKLASVTAELALVAFLWLVYLVFVGASTALNVTGWRWRGCTHLQCYGPTVMLAFGWMSWIALSVVGGITLVLALKRCNGDWKATGVWRGNAGALWEKGWAGEKEELVEGPLRGTQGGAEELSVRGFQRVE